MRWIVLLTILRLGWKGQPRGLDLLRKLVQARGGWGGGIEWTSQESMSFPLTCCVTLNKLPYLSVPLENRDHTSSHST